jgi:arginyl-tRNA--protein-N-Asp/Glu arginylyltransferase
MRYGTLSADAPRGDDAHMKSDLIRVFQTLEHPCGYYAGRNARNLVIDPLARGLPQVYGTALERGFRRSGGHVYRPHCQGCRACVAARVPVADFEPDRSQRRCLRRNADLELRIAPAQRSEENFALYRRYLAARHPDGGMDDPAEEDFERFLACAWSPTRFLELRHDGELLAVAVTDVLPQGLSAVYTFYAPEYPARGLGTCAILRQIEWARAERLPHVYLGYWIADHPKMGYKQRFRPFEQLHEGRWVRR